MKSRSTTTDKKRYWIIVASKDHVDIGVKGGFCQANHGKAGKLKQMKAGDGVLFYSSKEKYGESVSYQKFTAIGHVADDHLYQGLMNGGFELFRRNVAFKSAKEADIHPLIKSLDFIENKKYWGFKFRQGLFEISSKDFELISSQMLEGE